MNEFQWNFMYDVLLVFEITQSDMMEVKYG